MTQHDRPSRACPGSDRRWFLECSGQSAIATMLCGILGEMGFAADLHALQPRSRFRRINGVRLHYLEWGSASAPPMLLLHPGALNAHVWDAFGPAMARDFHVVAPDARGFGESQWSERYEGDVFVHDLHGLITALKLDRVILCGNSMGGTLALTYAALHSDMVERLILVDTGAGQKPSTDHSSTPSGTQPGGPPPIPPGPFASAPEAAAKIPATFGSAFAKAMTEHNLKRGSDGLWRWKHDHQGTTPAAERSMRDTRKWSFWTSIRCPTLLLRGAESPALPQRIAEQMVIENRNATLVVVPNAGHFVPIEQPAAFETAVRKWLGV